MEIDIERTTPRSFTGITNEEWEQFGNVVKSFLGSGKRSLFIATFIRKVNDNARWEFERHTVIEDRIQHGFGDTVKFFGFRWHGKKDDLHS